jgi:hypothetical protein
MTEREVENPAVRPSLRMRWDEGCHDYDYDYDTSGGMVKRGL